VTYKIAYDISYEKVADADQAEAVLDRLATMYGPSGHRCVAYIAPDSSDDPWLEAAMRVGVDLDLDRGFVSWLGDPVEYGYQTEVDPLDRGLTFDDDPDEPSLEMPPARTRVTATMARRAVREYLTTGHRPTCLPWLSDVAGPESDDGPTGGSGNSDSLASQHPVTEDPPNSNLAVVCAAITSMVQAIDPLIGTQVASTSRLGVSALYLTGIRQLLVDLRAGLADRTLPKEDAARLLRLLGHNLAETATLLVEEREYQTGGRTRGYVDGVAAVIAALTQSLTELSPKVMRLFIDADDPSPLVRV
jgi:hypothetical protein